jgi:hypothetical protein
MPALWRGPKEPAVVREGGNKMAGNSGNSQQLQYRLAITNWEAWGKLVKSWATSQNRLNPSAPPLPWPTTPQELQQQMDMAGAGSVPAEIESVYVTQMTEQKLVLNLPPKDDVLQAEADIKTGPYPLPPFYDKDCDRGVSVKNSCKMKFSDARVGEYVISYCG